MNTVNFIYVMQDENYEALAATFAEEIAIIYCRSNPKNSYREIPYINSSEFEVAVIAQPIPAEYLPGKSTKS